MDVLNGANSAAIGDGSTDNWEVFQFVHAALVGPDTYDLSVRLRGQQGSDALMPHDWPVGSTFVLLNGQLEQIDLAISARDMARHYRVGPAQRTVDDPSYVQSVEAFVGVGLRPYSPVRLVSELQSDGGWQIEWTRRTRIDGDSWTPADVPLGEAFESYLVRIVSDGSIKREQTVNSPEFTYTASMQAADAVTTPFEFEVAQLSDRFGPGLFSTIEVGV